MDHLYFLISLQFLEHWDSLASSVQYLDGDHYYYFSLDPSFLALSCTTFVSLSSTRLT